MPDYNQIEIENTVNLYPKRNLVLIKGKNSSVWDDKGNEYIDCTSGQGVASLGHSNEYIIRAVKEQADKIITCSGSFSNDKRALLSRKLIDISPDHLTQVFFCSTGTESIEAALKFARYASAKTDFVCAEKSFHGRTFGAMSATHNPVYRDDFNPVVPGFHFAPYNNFEALAEKITADTAAVILEVVQGEGGVNPGRREYLLKVEKLCREKNILFILDEIQTGFCRTGSMFAFMHFDLTPDIVCLAKAIAGGVPMGAVLCSDKIKMIPGKHGTTFGGNPLSCAAALAAITFMEKENLAQQALEKGRYFAEHFPVKELRIVKELRYSGLMIGIELYQESKSYIQEMQQKGVLVIPAGPMVIRLLPPLIISYEELDEVITKLVEVLKDK
jgi:acetylornithine/LysW-gamma-L-lysine aminotransferase